MVESEFGRFDQPRRALLSMTGLRSLAGSTLGALVLLTGCGGEEAENRVPPYIYKTGCEFSLELGEGNSTSTTIEKGNTMVTLTLSMGGYKVGVSDCKVVENPGQLPIYED